MLRRSPRPRRHENTILLDKLSKILTREKGAQGGGAKLPKVAAPPTAGGGLHDAYRKKVREQIDRENQSLLRRLQYMKPSIDMVHFEQQWRENAQFARSLAPLPCLSTALQRPDQLHKIGNIWLEIPKIRKFQNLFVLACAQRQCA